MDNDKVDNEIEIVLQKFKELHSEYEKGKQAQKELNEFLSQLREELKLARDAERTAEFKKNRCQGFVNQQQEVIQKLLSVKEENEQLKCTIGDIEKTLSDTQNNNMTALLKKDAEINKMKQDYLKELINIQEAADERVDKMKQDQVSTMEEFRKTIIKKEETIEQQSKSISSLQTEVKELKAREEINLDIYQKKLAEQERKHEAEIETWKLADLNKPMYQQGHQSSGMMNLYQSDYQYNTSIQPHQVNQSFQPFITRSRNTLPGIVRPTARSANNLQTHSDFLSANDFYLQNQKLRVENEEEKESKSSERMLVIQNIQKPKVLVPNKKRKLFNSDQNLL